MQISGSTKVDKDPHVTTSHITADITRYLYRYAANISPAVDMGLIDDPTTRWRLGRRCRPHTMIEGIANLAEHALDRAEACDDQAVAHATLVIVLARDAEPQVQEAVTIGAFAGICQRHGWEPPHASEILGMTSSLEQLTTWFAQPPSEWNTPTVTAV